MERNAENRDRQGPRKGLAASFKDAFSMIGREPHMKKRWIFYFFAGLVFGAVYWHYLSITARFFNDLGASENMIGEGLLFLLALLTYFGVWLIPAIFPAVVEFRRSMSLRFSVLAVVTVWVSAVLGYYVNYLVMLALVGLPHMEHLLILGGQTNSLWQEWSVIFPRLILSKFLKWTLVGVLAGGVTGLITGSLYSTLSGKIQRPTAV
jgi:hypothetical protein